MYTRNNCLYQLRFRNLETNSLQNTPGANSETIAFFVSGLERYHCNGMAVKSINQVGRTLTLGGIQ